MQCHYKLPHSVLYFCLLLIFTSTPALAIPQNPNVLSPIISFLLLGNGSNTLQGGHESITTWNGTSTCLSCHLEEAKQVFSSSHYQWLGETPYMTDGPSIQGKLDLGVNSYCINTTGNWNSCGACHVGLGLRPEIVETLSQLKNIDCLICHQQEYKRKKVDGTFVPDEANMSISMVQAARTVHMPNRTICLQCHANGGGGDNFKRGDMALAHADTTDTTFDVHMATTGADLTCQACHTTELHRIAGRGSDLRPTDLDVEMDCNSCHDGGQPATRHNDSTIDRHMARVSCQSCHIPTYAKNASDTINDERTEIDRDWLQPHLTASGVFHPTPTMDGDLVPRYAWWNGFSSSYLLFDDAVTDPQTGRFPTSRPEGAVNDQNAKLYPFKYKTASQPLATVENQLIALDTSVYFVNGESDAATVSGLVNMGYPEDTVWEWIETDTMQLITHEVPPASQALNCIDCHENTTRMDLVNSLGYSLKGSPEVVCVQCHDDKGMMDYLAVHKKHVESKSYDCSWCHGFSRPERNLRMP